jgi:hypothetical protein
MCLMSIRATGQTLARFVCASAARIALSATLTTPQPTAALQAIDTSGARSAPVVRLAEPTGDNGTAAAARDQPALRSGFVAAEPGSGWG